MELLVLDMNGVLTKETLAVELSRKYKPEGMIFWKQYSKGEISATDVALNVSATHKGITYEQIERKARTIRCVPNANEFIEHLRSVYAIVIVSTDYANLTRKVADELKIGTVFSNEAIYEDGIHIGKLREPIIADKEKAVIAQRLKKEFGCKRLVSIGDDITNMELFEISDFSIAYNGMEELKKVASVSVDSEDILGLLDFL